MSNTAKTFSYFYKLELEGINCFKDKQVLDLSDGNGNYTKWTIILGDNGTGKTTLLRVLDRMQPHAEDFNDSKIIVPIYFIDSELTTKSHNINLLYINYDKKIDFYKVKGNEGLYSFENQGGEYNFFLLSYGASRRMSKSQNISSKSNDKRMITSLFDESIELINAEEWLLQKELTAVKAESSSKNKFKKQLRLVKKILIDVLPDVKDIRVKPINEGNSKLLIEVYTPYGWVNLRDLSFGYQTLTALIVDIAAKMMEQYPDSENPLAEPVIVLIDEIDLHLHPKWQRTVLDKLSQHFPAAQFIATSHSPLIVQAAQDKGANIVVCRNEGDKVIIDNDPDEVKGWRVDQILVSDLFEIESSRSVKTQGKVNEYIVKKFSGPSDSDDSPEELEGFNEITANEPESELDKKLKNFANKYLK